MSKFTRLQVAGKMLETGIIPVFYHKDLNICIQVARSCYEGGIRVFEFTNRGDFAHEVFRDLAKFAAQELPEMIMGAGSIMDAGTASMYIQMGAGFIVSPVLNEDMGKVCNRRKILWAPGCGSVSEISRAEELGAEIVKIFPGSQVGGPEFIKSVKGPMPWSYIMPTGGVEPTEESLSAWFNAGAACVGMGSQLIKKTLIDKGEYAEITATCKQVMEWAMKYKKC